VRRRGAMMPCRRRNCPAVTWVTSVAGIGGSGAQCRSVTEHDCPCQEKEALFPVPWPLLSGCERFRQRSTSRSDRSDCHGGRHLGGSNGRHQTGERADQDGRGAMPRHASAGITTAQLFVLAYIAVAIARPGRRWRDPRRIQWRQGWPPEIGRSSSPAMRSTMASAAAARLEG
jgi:hypothetical protein